MQQALALPDGFTVAGATCGAGADFGCAEVEDEDAVFVDVGVVKADGVGQVNAMLAG